VSILIGYVPSAFLVILEQAISEDDDQDCWLAARRLHNLQPNAFYFSRTLWYRIICSRTNYMGQRRLKLALDLFGRPSVSTLSEEAETPGVPTSILIPIYRCPKLNAKAEDVALFFKHISFAWYELHMDEAQVDRCIEILQHCFNAGVRAEDIDRGIKAIEQICRRSQQVRIVKWLWNHGFDCDKEDHEFWELHYKQAVLAKRTELAAWMEHVGVVSKDVK
jgi:hypothetical protein